MAHPHLTAEQVELWGDLKENFTFTPNYLDLVRDMWATMRWYYRPVMWKNYVFPDSFVEEFTRHFHFPLNQVYYIVYIAIVITLMRYVFEGVICKVRSSLEDRRRRTERCFSLLAHCPLVRVAAEEPEEVP